MWHLYECQYWWPQALVSSVHIYPLLPSCCCGWRGKINIKLARLSAGCWLPWLRVLNLATRITTTAGKLETSYTAQMSRNDCSSHIWFKWGCFRYGYGTIMHHNIQKCFTLTPTLHPPELTQSPQLFRFVVFAKVLDFAKCILPRKFKNICIIPCWWLAAPARWVCAG